MKPFKVNADYEVELFHNKLAPPAINESIEFILFFLSSHPLYTQKEYSSEYLNYIEKRTNHIGVLIHTLLRTRITSKRLTGVEIYY